MSRTIAANDLKPLVERKAVTVIDVRRPLSTSCLSRHSHIPVHHKTGYDADRLKLPGADWKDPEKLADWSKTLPRDREVVLYCVRGGSVSNSVLDQLTAQGFQARYIEGGIEAWKTAGGATVTK